jgi:hypothetical protein
MAAIPPTTPPTIAPTGVLLAAESVVVLVELVGMMTKVVVTTCPEEFVVTYCEEIVEETSLVTVAWVVWSTVVGVVRVEAVDREVSEVCEELDEVDELVEEELLVELEELVVVVESVVGVGIVIAAGREYHDTKGWKKSRITSEYCRFMVGRCAKKK